MIIIFFFYLSTNKHIKQASKQTQQTQKTQQARKQTQQRRHINMDMTLPFFLAIIMAAHLTVAAELLLTCKKKRNKMKNKLARLRALFLDRGRIDIRTCTGLPSRPVKCWCGKYTTKVRCDTKYQDRCDTDHTSCGECKFAHRCATECYDGLCIPSDKCIETYAKSSEEGLASKQAAAEHFHKIITDCGFTVDDTTLAFLYAYYNPDYNVPGYMVEAKTLSGDTYEVSLTNNEVLPNGDLRYSTLKALLVSQHPELGPPEEHGSEPFQDFKLSDVSSDEPRVGDFPLLGMNTLNETYFIVFDDIV